MNNRVFFLSGILTVLVQTQIQAQAQLPVLRLEAGGPTSNVTALGFSPDGNSLYAAGFDKVVRTWRRDAQGKFQLDPETSYRVPIHPGTQGAINALAVSSDGLWLAVGGLGVVREGADFHVSGKLWPALGGLKPEMREDQGVIYAFHTQKREVRVLRGHRGPVLALAFAPDQENQPLLLASVARGWNQQTSAYVGEVRLWNVTRGEQVAERGDLSAPVHFRPGLAVFHTGAQANQAGLAIAWGDMHKGEQGNHGFLRLWDVAQNQVHRLEDGYENISLALRPDQKWLMTGSFRKGKGQLQWWSLEGGSANAQGQPAQLAYFPRSMTLFQSGVKNMEYAAVVMRDGLDSYLEIVGAGEDNFGMSRIQVPLWKNNPVEPLIAGSFLGSHLAVAGNADHTILVYAIADLLQKNARPQVLQSVGSTFRYVRFVQRGNDATKLGLVLAEGKGREAQPGFQPGDLFFDFAGRNLTGPEDWKPAQADAAGWQVQVTRDEGKTTRIVGQGQEGGRAIVLPAEQRLDSFAILPPRAPFNVPLVAVAIYLPLKGELALDLYNGQTGEKVRRFAGHLAPIRSLAFAPDGKLLASASEDQTVAVWSLTDLGEVFGKHGGITGLAVEKQNNKLVVAQVEADSPAAGLVQKGQVVEGVLDVKGEMKLLAKPFDFYETFWRSKPGTAVNVRLREGDQARDVKLTVGQGIDVRKPLFSLFITRDGQKGREWLGWNATGPFDSSRKDVETYLGWHFNTGQAGEPTRFAQINEYRKEYYKGGILKHLVAQANLAGALEEWKKEKNPPPPPPPQPKIKAILDGTGGVLAGNGDLLFRNRRGWVQFAIHNLNLENGDMVQWQLDGQPARTMDLPDGNLWSIPLTRFPEQPGRHKVRLIVQQVQPNQQVLSFSHDVTVRYQLPPPGELRYEKQQLQETVRQAEFPFECLLLGAAKEQKIKIHLSHQEKTEEMAATLQPEQPFVLKKNFNLQEGSNLIRVVAENQEPLAGFEQEERKELAVRVVYSPKAPAILMQNVEPVRERAGAAEVIPVRPGQTVWVDQPRVKVLGQIEAEENLLAPEYDLGPGTDRQKLPVKNLGKKVPVQVDLVLKPGEQQFRFYARAGQSKEVAETLTLGYRPPLPRIVITSPAGDTVVRANKEEDKGEIALAGKLLQPRDASPKPFTMKVHYLVNGKERSETQDMPSDARELPTRKLALQPGNNTLQVRLSSAWDTGPKAEPAEVQVRFVRPPHIIQVQPKLVGELPFVNLEAQVSSPIPLLPEQVVVEVNGQRKSAKAKVTPGKDRTWNLSLQEIPLDVDENRKTNENFIRLQVANAEDQSEKSKDVLVKYTTPPPPRPEIVLDSPEITLKEPELNIKFQVRSKKPLKQVEVISGTKVLFRAGEELARLQPNAQGLYEFETGQKVLSWGLNEVRVEAVNDGGPRSARLVVTVPEWPVQIDFDRLVSEGAAKEQTLLPSQLPGGKLTFPESPDGHVTLEGKIRWSSKDDTQLKTAHLLRVHVNGFQQMPALLFPAEAGARVRKFEAKISLPWKENFVKLSLPDLKKEANNRQSFTVECARPVRGQHVHVVIVAPGETDSNDLKARFAKAFAASPVGRDLFRSGVFESVRLYALNDYVQPLEVLTRLDNIGSILKSRAAQGFPNDLLLVYYWGRESEQMGERYFWTSETEANAIRTGSLRLRELADKYFARFAGAQVLLLDLFPVKDEIATTSKAKAEVDYRFGVLTYHSRSATSTRQPLLGQLEKAMPTVNWLDQLIPTLTQGAQKMDPPVLFQHYLPAHLKVQLHPAKGTVAGGGQ